MIGLAVGGPIDDTASIQDCILGTAINGMGHTVGQTTTSLKADPAYAMFDAISDAVNYSNNVGRNGPVCIYSTSRTWLGSDKRLWLDEAGVHALTAATTAQAQTTITNIVSIKGRQIVERIAWRRAEQQLGEAEAIASQHAAARFAARVDARAEPLLQQANEQYAAKVRGPLEDRRAFPRHLDFTTLASALQISGVTARASQLAAPSAPPELTQPADVALFVHESMINNLAEIVFTGMRLNDAMVQHAAVELLGRLPDQLKPDQEPFTVVFPPDGERTPPVTVSFGNDGLTVTLRGKEYIANGRTEPGMDVTAAYKFVKTAEGYKAVRQGDLQIYGFGQVPGTKRSFRQEGIFVVLQRKFGKLFAAEIKLQGLAFNPGKLATAGRIVPREIIAQHGWLVIGYRRQAAIAPTVAVQVAAAPR